MLCMIGNLSGLLDLSTSQRIRVPAGSLQQVEVGLCGALAGVLLVVLRYPPLQLPVLLGHELLAGSLCGNG